MRSLDCTRRCLVTFAESTVCSKPVCSGRRINTQWPIGTSSSLSLGIRRRILENSMTSAKKWIRLLLTFFRFAFRLLSYAIKLYTLLKTCGASAAVDAVTEVLKTHAWERASDLAAAVRSVTAKVEAYLQELFGITPACGCRKISKATERRLTTLIKQEFALAA